MRTVLALAAALVALLAITLEVERPRPPRLAKPPVPQHDAWQERANRLARERRAGRRPPATAPATRHAQPDVLPDHLPTKLVPPGMRPR